VGPDATTFRDWLIEQDLSAHTADVYASMIDYGRRHGDVTAAVLTANSKGTLKVVKSAVRWWSRWTGDRRALGRVRALARKQIAQAHVVLISDEERAKLCTRLRWLEEPYRSAMVVIACSGLRLNVVLGLSREQAEVGKDERVPILGVSGDVINDGWLAPPDVQQAFRELLKYAWVSLQDVLGRDYFHAYRQVAAILRHECRRAGIRRIKPAELGRSSNS
jgi:hypothetical protein